MTIKQRKILLAVLIPIWIFLVSGLHAQWKAFPPSSGGSSFIWSKTGESTISDSLRFIQGTGATLTQTGNTLTIAATGTGLDSASAVQDAGWKKVSTEVSLHTITDEIEIGSAGTHAAKFAIDGDADEVQIKVQGNATQSNEYILVEKSDGTDLLRLHQDSNTTVNLDLGATGADTDRPRLHIYDNNALTNASVVDVGLLIEQDGAGNCGINFQRSVEAVGRAFGITSGNVYSWANGRDISAPYLSFDPSTGVMTVGNSANDRININSSNPNINFIETGGGNATITVNTSDAMTFTGGSGGYTFDNNVVFTAGTLDASSTMAGLNIFSGSSEIDTVLVSGAASTDMYFINFRTAIDATVTGHYVTAKTDTFIVTLIGVNTGTPEYNWLRVKQ